MRRPRRLVGALLAVAMVACALSATPVAAAPATHGAAQVSALERDRPRLAAILAAHPPLRDWIAGEFESRPLDLRLHWDRREPVSGRAAEHEYPSRTGTVPPGSAAVRVSARLSGWDQLAALVFELHNFRGGVAFDRIHRDAVSGAIDRPEYVRRCLAQEYAAQLATREFLAERVAGLPGAGSGGSRLYWQKLRAEPTLEAHLAKAGRNRRALERHYEDLHEAEVVPARESRAR